MKCTEYNLFTQNIKTCTIKLSFATYLMLYPMSYTMSSVYHEIFDENISCEKISKCLLNLLTMIPHPSNHRFLVDPLNVNTKNNGQTHAKYTVIDGMKMRDLL